MHTRRQRWVCVVSEVSMKCELWKTNNANQGMSMRLNDVNGSITVQLCQPCLKKLKNAVKDPKPQKVEIYPATTK